MVLYLILLSQSWSTAVPNVMLVSRIAQSGKILALSRLAIGIHISFRMFQAINGKIGKLMMAHQF